MCSKERDDPFLLLLDGDHGIHPLDHEPVLREQVIADVGMGVGASFGSTRVVSTTHGSHARSVDPGTSTTTNES